jgi:hypothetical protein
MHEPNQINGAAIGIGPDGSPPDPFLASGSCGRKWEQGKGSTGRSNPAVRLCRSHKFDPEL